MGSTLLLSKVLLRQNLATMLGLDATGRRRRSQRSSLIVTVIVAIVLLLITGAVGYSVQSFGGSYGLGRPLLSLLLGGTGIMMFLLAIPAVLGAFYASSDIEDLLPLPLSGSSIVAAKSIAAIASSYVFPTMILLGPLAGWGIAAGAGPLYWVSAIVLVLFAPLLPFAYAGILSMLIARFLPAARRKDVVTTISTIIAIAIVILAMVTQQFSYDSSSIAALAQMRGLVGGMLAAFPSYGFGVDAVVTQSMPALAAFVGISAVGIAVFIAFAQLVYLRTATSLSSSGGQSRTYGGETGNAARSVGRAILRTDLRRTFRTPALWLNQALMPVIIMVIATVSMATQALPPLMESLRFMDGSGLALTASLSCSMIVLLAGLVGSANRLSGTVISREGSNWDFVKVVPVGYGKMLRAKMVPSVAVNMVLLVIPVCALLVPLTAAGLSPIVIVCTVVHGCSLSWLGACIAVNSDTINPRVSWGNDAEIDNKSVGGGAALLRGLIVTILYSALPLIALFGLPWMVALPVVTVVGLVVALALGRVFLRRASRHLAELER